MIWAELTWEELPGVLAAAQASAILPVGATEQHGPQLGCGVDTVVAETLCRAVAAKSGVPMLPPLPYGCSLGHSRRWPGTITLQPITLIEVVRQIGDHRSRAWRRCRVRKGAGAEIYFPPILRLLEHKSRLCSEGACYVFHTMP